MHMMMTCQKIPPTNLIHQSHGTSTNAVGGTANDVGGILDSTATSTGREENAQEEVTLQDLQAMKQMIREIRQNPELLYKYSPAFSQLTQSVLKRLPMKGPSTIPAKKTINNNSVA
mmetsp:Transcript_24683/g.40201  ORF Transcript_24683/g.40201 Transcript_24683/m.40201 type:complete len:116 (+) Transcript_24683:197-544(+)|eukprot:CAMPEP_0196134362 /NCGR_PEP_ID=MMETSP0910-20130528/3295_1 /TAXON_ID=49265 /ORGANISM="Thalassiosira rotula, Strain GSO102" /LENGTH=115 /DNA_ID=CAMNT_0041394277 /DNA_START=272 /DNA_END=619 /DNA_ORIENTATION=+